MSMEKDKYRLLLHFLPDAFAYHRMLTDSAGNALDYVFLEVNPAFESMTGLRRDAILGKKVTEVLPGIEHTGLDWIGAYGRVALNGESICFEQYCEALQRWYEVTAYSDVPGYFATVFRDVTRSKLAYQATREKEEHLTVILNSIGDGVIVCDLDGRITNINPQAKMLTGWAYAEAAGRQLDEVFRIVNTRTGEPAFNPVQQVMETGNIVGLANDTALISRGGAVYQIADSAAPVRDSEGNTTGVVVVFSDITEQYKARAALEETMQRLEFIMEATKTGIMVIDGNFDIHYVDNHWQKIYGDPAGRKCYDYFWERQSSCEDCAVPLALETKQITVSERLLPKEGNRVVEAHTVPFQNQQGDWLAAQFYIDITKRKAVEKALAQYEAKEALRQSETRYRTIVENTNDALFIYNFNGEISDVNENACKMLGYEREELLRANLSKIISSEDHNLLPVRRAQLLKHSRILFEGRLIRKDGSAVAVEISAKLVSPDGDSVILAFVRDITERRRQQAALQKEQQEKTLILDNLSELVTHLDPEMRIIWVNPAIKKTLGITSEESLGKKCYEAWHGLKAICKGCPVSAAKKSGQICHGELRSYKGRYWQMTASPIYDEKNILSGFLVTALDISERKLAEQKIVANAADLKMLNEQLNAEMDKARQLHERTLPKVLPRVEGLSFAAHYQPAQKLGGDFYDVVRQGNKLIIYISDVTGHGVDGAMLSVLVKHSIRGYLTFAAAEALRPGEILRYLAAQFRRENLPENYFICIFLAVLDLDTLLLSYSGAGFQDAPLVHMGNGDKLTLSSRGLFLNNAFPEEMLNLREGQLQLTPGSTILFNTDGLSEQGAGGVYYGPRLPAAFYAYSQLPPALIVEGICEDFRRFNNGSLQGKDDITFLVLQVAPAQQQTYYLELASDFQELAELRNKLKELTGTFNEAEIFMACLHELVVNAMEHGNRLERQKKVGIELILRDGFMHAVVEDEGNGFGWREIMDRPLELEGLADRGRGIAITRMCAGLCYNEKGNRAMLTVYAREGGNKIGE
ncbi:MAG: PAS domain S-box protein [Bacillota bacterium]